MNEENLLTLKYKNHSYVSLCKELDQCKSKHNKDLFALAEYQAAFAWLEKQKWFQNNRHKLTEYLKEDFEQLTKGCG